MAVELIRGANGVFDVLLGEEVVFSKHRQDRFPETGEILAILRARAADPDLSSGGQ